MTNEKKVSQVRRYARLFRGFGASGEDEGAEYLEHLTDLDPEGQVLREVKYFEDGTEEEVSTYVYDSAHRLTGHTLQYVPDETSEKRVLERDGEGRLVRETKLYGELEGERTEYSYDDKGRVAEIRSFDEEGDFASQETVTYNGEGKITGRASTGPAGEILERKEYAYTDDGAAVTESVFDASGQLLKRTTSKFDEQQRETDTEERTGQGKRISAIRSSYDDRGNLVERRFIDFYSKTLRYAFDEQNHCISEELSDDQGRLLRKRLFDYDDEGRLAAEKSYEMDLSRGGRDRHQELRYEYEFHT